MSTSCYVGTADTSHPHLVRARFVLLDGYPHVIVPTLSQIWARHAGGDSTALIEAILAHDWEYLDADIDADITAHATSGFAGHHPATGIGMTLAATSPEGSLGEPDPVCVFPLSQAGELDVGWIYLIEPATATVTVHTADGEPAGGYHLAHLPAPARTPAASAAR
jgi:hypothetical protein